MVLGILIGSKFVGEGSMITTSLSPLLFEQQTVQQQPWLQPFHFHHSFPNVTAPGHCPLLIDELLLCLVDGYHRHPPLTGRLLLFQAGPCLQYVQLKYQLFPCHPSQPGKVAVKLEEQLLHSPQPGQVATDAHHTCLNPLALCSR